MTVAKKFWSDDFDMDLLKLFPDLPKTLGETAERKLWTVGHETYGRFNHPTVWNTHGAFVWLDKPNLKRDEHGWYNVCGCVGNEPEIECTWLELLRDQWPHGYGFILLPTLSLFSAPPGEVFDIIMSNIRGWRDDGQQAELAARSVALTWLNHQTRQLEAEIERAASAGCSKGTKKDQCDT